MNRAAVLIGVRKTTSLPLLQAVWNGVYGMQDWARTQGFATELIEVITDENEKVTPQRISSTVKKFVDRGDLDQLIIYFAGHGVNVDYGEYWLLSDAIDDANAAVNVKGSEERARFGTVPHVVFVSDACRSAAAGVQAQGVTGSIIFPNKPVTGPEKQVDLFFATLLGEPALEISTPIEAAQRFKGVYTEVLLEALFGQHPDVTDPGDKKGQRFVRPRPLKKYLMRELPIRVYQATMGSDPRNQQPDARITSDPEIWLSELDVPEIQSTETNVFGSVHSIKALEHANFAEIEMALPTETARAMIADCNADISRAVRTMRGDSKTDRADLDIFSWRNQQFQNAAMRFAETFGPGHFDSKCGFKIRGQRVTDCLSGGATFQISGQGTLVQTDINTGPCASVLLIFADGHGAFLPAIRDCLATLNFENSRLVDVAYEPSDNSEYWAAYQPHSTELRNLRSVIASSTRMGTFRLEDEDAVKLWHRMRFANSIDVSLALYAAHPYRELGQRERIVEMSESLREKMKIRLFDIELLAGRIHDSPNQPIRTSIDPGLPMLSASWALMSAYEVPLPSELNGIRKHVLTDSLWTLYDAGGVRLITQAIRAGGIP